jgi:hypothetical protein
MPKQENLHAASGPDLQLGQFTAPQIACFWRMQDGLLHEAEAFCTSWFERRHEATRSALEAVTTMKMGDPAGAMRAIADWQLHSAQRLSEDARECWSMMSRCAGSAVRQEVEAAEEVAEQSAKSVQRSALYAVPL